MASGTADDYSSSLFSAFRTKPFPTFYDELKTAVTVDVLEVGWIVAFFTLAFSIYVVIPGQQQKIINFIMTTLALFLGLSIMMCNFGYHWECGHLSTHTPYRAGTGDEIEADIGLYMGLRGVNITLKADPPSSGVLMNETINYNERFSWVWHQGRAGFGPMAGQIQRDFRYHQRRGTPIPILWIAEYFTFDGEGFRFGRNYRVAGWYAHICLWTAFPTWILTMILFNMVIKYGAIMLTTTGALMTIASIIWSARRNSIELVIPFNPPDDILTTHFGFHFYLCLIVGIISMILGLAIYFLDKIKHNELCNIFGINPLQYADLEITEEHESHDNVGMDQPGDLEMAPMTSSRSSLKSIARGVRKSLTIRVRGKGTSRQSLKVQHMHVDDLPPPPPPLMTISEDSDPSSYAYGNAPIHPPPRPPKNY